MRNIIYTIKNQDEMNDLISKSKNKEYPYFYHFFYSRSKKSIVSKRILKKRTLKDGQLLIEAPPSIIKINKRIEDIKSRINV